MEATWATTVAAIVILALIWGWRVLNWVWLRPKKLERLLRKQGLQGNPYRILIGDSKDVLKMHKEAKSKPMNVSDDIVPRVSSYDQHSVNKFGMPMLSPFFLFVNCLLFASSGVVLLSILLLYNLPSFLGKAMVHGYPKIQGQGERGLGDAMIGFFTDLN